MLKRLLHSPLIQNVSRLAFAELVAKAMAFLVVVRVSRILGPENYGTISFAMALVAFFKIGVNLGLPVVGARELSKDTSRGPFLLSNLTSIFVLSFVLSYSLLTVTTLFFLPENTEAVTRTVILIYGFTLLLNPDLFEWQSIGFERYQLIAASRIIHGLVYAGLTYLVISTQDQLVDFAVLQILCMLLLVSVLVLPYRKQYRMSSLSPSSWWGYLFTGFFFAGSAMMTSAFNNLDKLMLGIWHSDAYVGWYDAAFRLVVVANVPSALFWSVFTPRISRRSIRDVKLFIAAMVASGLFLAVCVFLFRDIIVHIVYGDQFSPSAQVLSVLSFTILLKYITRSFIGPLFLWNKERLALKLTIGAFILNFFLNLALVPRFHYMGASWATLIMYIALVVATGLFFLKEFKAINIQNR